MQNWSFKWEKKNLLKIKYKAKVYTTQKLKNRLLFCNMNTYKARKAIYEKVRVVATLTDRNL